MIEAGSISNVKITATTPALSANHHPTPNATGTYDSI